MCKFNPSDDDNDSDEFDPEPDENVINLYVD